MILMQPGLWGGHIADTVEQFGDYQNLATNSGLNAVS